MGIGNVNGDGKSQQEVMATRRLEKTKEVVSSMGDEGLLMHLIDGGAGQ